MKHTHTWQDTRHTNEAYTKDSIKLCGKTFTPLGEIPPLPPPLHLLEAVNLTENISPIVLACGTNIGKENGVSRGSDHYLGEFLTGRLERYGHLSHFGPYEAPELIAERIRLFLVDQLGQGIKMPRYLSFLKSNY